MTQPAHTPLYPYKNYVTDKQSFGFDESGARIGETPNILMCAGTEELANLLAAAPDLLAALKEVNEAFVSLYEQCDPDGEIGVWGEWNQLALRAIAKAEGR